MTSPITHLKRTKQVHYSWYLKKYPDVVQLGMDPAEHYLKYGAAMGRNPGKGFDTQAYLEANPDVAASGINPLLHYALCGKGEGRSSVSSQTSFMRSEKQKIDVIRGKLLSLGFTEQPLADLQSILCYNPYPEIRAMAAREIALWFMREKTDEGYRKALFFIKQARSDTLDVEFRSRLATVELLCHYHLGDHEAGRQVFGNTGCAGEVTPDVMLAWVNFQPTPESRISWINQVLRHYNISPVALTDETTRLPYDRLTGAGSSAEIKDGPLVTVLIAAYDAANMLPTALRSLQEQSWHNLEIIVIDDCSPTDDTAAVAERFAKTDPRIRLIRMPENGGAYIARNTGLDAATGTYVTLQDADDWSHPQKIETQVRFMEDNPEVIGCTTQEARATSELAFTRWTGEGYFLITNTSSFLFRRHPMRTHLGYWDTVRFSADNELIRRMQTKWGREAVRHLESGPYSFQRHGDSSIIADSVLGVDGFFFGVRREYYDAQQHYHASGQSLKYTKAGHPFPTPALMHPDRRSKDARREHLPFAIASDFRMLGSNIKSCFKEVRAARAAGFPVAVFEMNEYDVCFNAGLRSHMLEDARDDLTALDVRVITYGEHIYCDLLLLCYPPILQHRQRYIPKIDARDIRVIVNQLPMSDYTEDGIELYDIAVCAENIRHHFGKDATWHPTNPLVRDALNKYHKDELRHINLSEQDWHNIINIKA